MFKFAEKNRKWWILLAMSSSLALVFIDQTALAVALPAIQRELNLSNSLTQWVINAYLLALSAIILFGGKIGDRLGHKRTFLAGVIVFISASILSALAESGAWLITARAIQGFGAAFMMPSTNALVTNAFPKQERGKALGIYIALATIFLALGPLLGGFLTQVFSWRAVFWINFPIALISIILAVSSVPTWQRLEKLNIDYLHFSGFYQWFCTRLYGSTELGLDFVTDYEFIPSELFESYWVYCLAAQSKVSTGRINTV
jgi:MFS family permease